MSRAGARCVLALALASVLAARAAEAGVVTVGQQPPPFELADETGKTYRLQDMLGRPIILYFTHNMCHYCTQVIGFLSRARAAHSEDALTILAINVWAADDKFIRRYKEQFGLPFPMLAGKNAELLRNYEVNYVPIVVFIDRGGTVRRIDHHYILPEEFDAAVRTIVQDG